MSSPFSEPRIIDPAKVAARERYELLTSLVTPRPIGWLSTWSEDGVANLAPFSYFMALSASPMLVGVSIADRRDGPKDTLVNLRARGAFCANLVEERHLEEMNASSAAVGREVDEFGLTGLGRATSDRVDAPYVEDCPAVLECEVRREIDLGEAPNTLVIAEVVGIRLAGELSFEEGTMLVMPEDLRTVGRLGGSAYVLPGAVRRIPRPDRG